MLKPRLLAGLAASVLLGGVLLASGATANAGAASGATANAGAKTATPKAGGVSVTDIQIPVPGQPSVLAYLVRPQGHVRPHSLAGVLYLHWFEPGQSTQSRDEFLAEAVGVVRSGAVAVLPQLTFPWEGDPVGDSRDRATILAQLDAVTRAYRALLSDPAVDPARTAVVGHDYGAMYGSILAQRDRRVRAEVFMAGDATWANWFDTYWLGLPDDQKAAYRAVFAGLDPVDNVSRLGGHLFLQWAGRDPFIPAEVRDAFSAANPAARVGFYERADHFLSQQARDERTAWLAGELGLG
jgi:dienelactone hydrolase